MPITPPQTLQLSSGAITTELDNSFCGVLLNVIVNKDGGTNNPDVAITEQNVLGRTVLDITESGSGYSKYPVREENVGATGTGLSTYSPFIIESPLQVAITGGDASGTVTVAFQYIPY